MTLAVKPLVRIVLTFAIVWFYYALTSGFLSGWLQLVVVVFLAVPTWILVARALFPSGSEDVPMPWDGDEKP